MTSTHIVVFGNLRNSITLVFQVGQGVCETVYVETFGRIVSYDLELLRNAKLQNELSPQGNKKIIDRLLFLQFKCLFFICLFTFYNRWCRLHQCCGYLGEPLRVQCRLQLCLWGFLDAPSERHQPSVFQHLGGRESIRRQRHSSGERWDSDSTLKWDALCLNIYLLYNKKRT